jgi:CRISPR system Cascade subunit CasD
VSGWLVVLIAAPLASFGEEPGNVRRGTADRPTRSALLGLAGAALGIERADQQSQDRLSASFLTATRTLSPGAPLTDFHTFQSLPAAKGVVATRADALARHADLETSITRRDYRTDGLWQAAYAARENGQISLDDLREAFLRPRFVLFAGRKSCALAQPLAPTIVATEDVDASFVAHARQVNRALKTIAVPPSGGSLAIDERAARSRHNIARRHRRNDEPGDRTRRHFSARFERISPMTAVTTNPDEDAS